MLLIIDNCINEIDSLTEIELLIRLQVDFVVNLHLTSVINVSQKTSFHKSLQEKLFAEDNDSATGIN